MRDTYKNVPVCHADFRLQGFRWLGQYFLETQLIFGGTTSVPSCDCLGHTTLDVAVVESAINPDCVHRALDDAPIVTPADSPTGPIFAAAYEDLCKTISIHLGAPCLEFEKAFIDSTVGTVLSVRSLKITHSTSHT